jgi:hypothetical protein
MTLTIELVSKSNEPVIEIYFDREGLNTLKYFIEKIEKHNGPYHEHLMTPSWSGDALTEILIGEGNVLVNQVTMSLLAEAS